MAKNGMRAAMTWLHRKREQTATEPVQYLRRGNAVPVPMRATLGKCSDDQLIEQEMFTNSDVRDFVISAKYMRRALFLEGEHPWREPRPGDQITVDQSGAVYEVCEIGQARCWRYSDEYHQAVRVHARELTRAD